MIKAIIFDMDGLLLDTERYYFRCWLESAQRFGFSMKPRQALAVRSLSAKYAERYLKRELGAQFDYFKVRAYRRALVQERMEQDGIQTKPGAEELLRYCQAQGIVTAVATATPLEHAKAHLQRAGLLHYFSAVVGGDSIANGKPEPDIYRHAVQQLGLQPEECLALEDSPNGILAAFGAGCHPVMIPDLTEPDELLKPILYAWCPSLAEVVPLLEQEQKKEEA